MAEIVLGIGTSHGPMLVTETESWGLRVPADKANKHAWRGGTWTFDELVEARMSPSSSATIRTRFFARR